MVKTNYHDDFPSISLTQAFVFSILQKTNSIDLQIYIIESTPFETELFSIPQSKFEEIYELRDNLFLVLNIFV